MNEKRALQRFTIELPVHVFPSMNGGHNVVLKSIDICSLGAFIETPDPFPVGTRLEMDVFLLSNSGAEDDIIRTNGEVIRTGPTGMAVRFDEKYQILPIEYFPEQ